MQWLCLHGLLQICDSCSVFVFHNLDTLEESSAVVSYLVEQPSVWACLVFSHGSK